MSTIRVPTPLRAYTEGVQEVPIEAENVGAALRQLVARYPALHTHLFNEQGDLRPYINLFVNDLNARELGGEEAPINNGDRLIILPSIAGGAGGEGELRAVDHSALRINQAAIIALLLAAFIADAPGLVLLVGLVMLLGTAWGVIGFLPFYRLLRASGWVTPDLIPDHPEPHRFAQGFGGVVLGGAGGAFLADLPALAWGLTWLVIVLAGLNLFGGFCVGCAVYYWFNRLGLPGFRQAAPPGVLPGRRPPRPGGQGGEG